MVASSYPSGVLIVRGGQRNSGVNSRLLTPLFPVRVPFGDVVGQSGKPTQEFTTVRGPGPLAEHRGFPAIFARIYAVGLECQGESAVPAAIG